MPPIDYDISLWALTWMSIAIHSSGNSFSQCLPRVQQHFTKVFPSPRFQRRLCKSPSRNNHSRFFCCVDNTVADIPRSRSNARTPLYDAPTASNLGTAYRIRRTYWKRKSENMKTIWMKIRNIKAKWIQLQTSPARLSIRYYFHGEWRYFCLLITSSEDIFLMIRLEIVSSFIFLRKHGENMHELPRMSRDWKKRSRSWRLSSEERSSQTVCCEIFVGSSRLAIPFRSNCKNSSEPLTPKQFWRNPFQHEGKLPNESDPLCEGFS